MGDASVDSVETDVMDVDEPTANDAAMVEKLEELEFLKRELADIQEAEREVAKRARNIETIKMDLKEAKEEYAGAVDSLRSLVRATKGDQNRPLLQAAKPKEEEEKPATIEDESWKQVKLDTLEIPPGTLKLMEENPGFPILTIGDLTAWTAMGKQLSDIKGVGPGKATKIEDAMETYWAENPVGSSESDDQEEEQEEEQESQGDSENESLDDDIDDDIDDEDEEYDEEDDDDSEDDLTEGTTENADAIEEI